MKKIKKEKDIKIPKEFKKYFWDVDFGKLSFKKHYNFILTRVMNFGNFKALCWLFKIPKDKIKETVRTSRELDAKTRNYWQIIYGK